MYTIRVTAGTGRRPTSPEAKRIQRSVNAATTGLAAGAVLLGIATTGFHDLAGHTHPAAVSP